MCGRGRGVGGWGRGCRESSKTSSLIGAPPPLPISQKNTDAAVDLGRSAVQLVSRLPDGALCKLLGTREVGTRHPSPSKPYLVFAAGVANDCCYKCCCACFGHG